MSIRRSSGRTALLVAVPRLLLRIWISETLRTIRTIGRPEASIGPSSSAVPPFPT